MIRSRAGKTPWLVDLLRERIRHGEYFARELPAERDLADEVGVSRMTARKALLELVEAGLLVRQDNRRIVLNREGARQSRTLLFLTPSLTSPSVEAWRVAAARVLREHDVTLRSLMYRHWYDGVIPEALPHADGVLLYPASEPIPDHVRDLLARGGRKVACVEHDLSELGIPSLTLFPAAATQRLLDHLADLGHRSIDCLNVQVPDEPILGRVEQWNLWRGARGVSGQFHDGVRADVHHPLERAHRVFGELLDAGQVRSTALLCTTAPAAIGAIRAMADRGMRAGADLSVCAVNDENLGRYLVPSLTSLTMPDPTAMLQVAAEWLLDADRPWAGPLRMQPADVPLFAGESTGPARQ